MSTSHWVGDGSGAGTAQELAPGRTGSTFTRASLITLSSPSAWGNPLPCAQLPGVALPSPGSESLHPLPLGGLGVGTGGAGLGLTGMCGAGGWESGGQVSLPSPTGGF